MWRGSPSPGPEPLRGHPSYYQYAGSVVSLNCRPGKVVVRAVFKPTAQRDNACVRLLPAAGGNVAHAVSEVTRCQLELPPHGGSVEEELAAAVRSKEVNCKPCTSCASCPHTALDRWYSDTFTASFEGCAALARNPGGGYQPFIPAMVVRRPVSFGGGGRRAVCAPGREHAVPGRPDAPAAAATRRRPRAQVNPGSTHILAKFEVQEVK